MFQFLAMMQAEQRSVGARRRSLPRHLLHRLTALVAMLVAACVSQVVHTQTVNAESSDHPNIILIMTDDQGYGDFGSTGNPVIRTPHIDAMARRSGSMETFYVCPVCSPTRASLMTGRYNYRTRVIDTWLGRSMMEPDEVTVAEVLRDAGYAAGIFGKWHLGDTYPMRARDQGFEQSLVHRGGGLAQPSEPRENKRRYTNPILFRNGEQVQTKGYCTDVYFDAALKFITQAQQDQQPFFVYLPTNAPHGPYHDVPDDLRRQYLEQADQLKSLIVNPPRNSDRLDQEIDRLTRIAAMITNVDQNVGQLFQTLEQLNLTENTVVIFLVDNGPNTRRYAGPFRGMKSEVYEGGVRSPLWIHWPKQIPAGNRSDVPAAHIDIMPTILDACGVALPPTVNLDGRSFLPLVTDEPVNSLERAITIQSHRGDQPVRYHHFMTRLGPWKLVHNSGFSKEQFSGDPRFELYNIDDDPGETRNLIEQQPAIFTELKAAYDRWFDDVSNTRPDNYAPPRIHIGSPHEQLTVLTRQDWRGGSWARNAVGFWKLHVEQPGNYDVRLLFDPGANPETAQLRIGEIQQSAKVRPGQDSIQLRHVRLKEGPAELHATLSRDERTRGVYQVEISRVP